MGKTAISWTDDTWNPVRGCSRVSEGCRHCYAEQQAARIVRMGKGTPTAYDGLVRTVRLNRHPGDEGTEGRWTGEVRLIAEHIADPLKWRKPRRIFVNSMSDLFHESLTNEQIAAVFGVMAACPQHTFQVLTKRARRMREWFEWLRGPSEDSFTMRQRGIVAAPNTARALLDAAYEYLGKARKPELDAAWAKLEDDPWPLQNVHLGVSVENQDVADERIPELLRTPAVVRFLSCEPLLGPIQFKPFTVGVGTYCYDCGGAGVRIDEDGCCATCGADAYWYGVDWIIAGCESGPGARPCDVAWLRSLRDQCAAAGVPYFLKQATEVEGAMTAVPPPTALEDQPGYSPRVGPFIPTIGFGPGSKRKTGGVIELPYLDGEQHAAFPKVGQ